MEHRQASLADLPQLHRIEQALFGEHAYPYFVIRQYFDGHPNGFWLAVEGDEVLGYVIMTCAKQANERWVMALAVAKQAQGRGLAKGLMQQALRAYHPELDARLTVDPSNSSACHLYRKLGFALETHDEGYFGVGEARDVMCYKVTQ